MRSCRREISTSRRLHYMYVQERAEEKAARFCGLVHPSAANGRKMVAFKASSYGNNNTVFGSRQIITSLANKSYAQTKQEDEFNIRGGWLREKCAHSRALQAYHADEIRFRNTSLIESLMHAKAKTRAFSLLKQRNKTKAFKFPAQIYRNAGDVL